MEVDLYTFFGLSEGFSATDLKRAYKAIARKLHPDKNKENPKAKEQFQELKEHYDLLHNPVTRNEYERKWKAKRESIRRHAALDEERRKLKEKLESREADARRLREDQRKFAARDVIADQIRREWELRSEEVQWEARVSRKRQQDADKVQHSSSEKTFRVNNAESTTVRVKWSTEELGSSSMCYTKDFITTCLSEYGEITAVVLGKKGSAIAEFVSRKEAMAAVAASKRNLLGIPTFPLNLTVIAGSFCEESGETDKSHCSENTESPFPRNSSEDTGSKGTFDAFESDILSRMASFTD